MNKEYARVDARERSGRLTIGVHMDRNAIQVVEVLNGRITSWANQAMPADRGDPAALPQTLKRALEPFEAVRREARVWALGAFPSLQVRFLNIPKPRAGQLSNLVYWQFRKEIPFDAALTTFDYDTEGSVEDGAPRRLDVTAYAVLQADVDALRDLFRRAAYPLDGIVIPHFAMRNLYQTRWIQNEETSLCVYVGDEASSLQINSRGHVVLNRVFITGMNSIMDILHNRHPEWTPADIFARLSDEAGEESREAREIVRPALGRLMQQVERSMAAYLVGRGNDEIKCVHVMGELAAFPGLIEEMGAHWGIQTQSVHLFEAPHLGAGVEPPPDPAVSAAMSMATGVALSDDTHTPNLLHTYVRRDREARLRRTRSLVTAGGGFVLVAFLALYALLAHSNQNRANELAMLRAKSEQYMFGLQPETIAQLMTDLEVRHARLREVAHNCRAIATLNQVAAMTPPDIRLARIEIATDLLRERDRPAGHASPQVIMAGLVRGAPDRQESKLASYVIQLEDARLFAQVRVVRSLPGDDMGEPVTLFDMEMFLEAWTDPSAPDALVASKEFP